MEADLKCVRQLVVRLGHRTIEQIQYLQYFVQSPSHFAGTWILGVAIFWYRYGVMRKGATRERGICGIAA